jgi:mannose-6-phosphate isomerase-like protein (cupin superfamily)
MYSKEMTAIQNSHPDDAVNIAPHLHTVIYEDDKMRVLKVTVKPGDMAKMHWHPHNINYVLAAGTLRFVRPDGTSASVELTEGQVTSSQVESLHEVENIGDTTVATIQVELKY